jgi:hypothetical protein
MTDDTDDAVKERGTPEFETTSHSEPGLGLQLSKGVVGIREGLIAMGSSQTRHKATTLNEVSVERWNHSPKRVDTATGITDCSNLPFNKYIQG